jgi:hypothetical protein
MSANPTTELAAPIPQPGTDDDVAEVREKFADVAAAMVKRHPPTNRRLLIATAEYWTDVVGPNDPIVQSILSWVVALSNDDVSQLEAGMTVDQHQALRTRLGELGLRDDDD